VLPTVRRVVGSVEGTAVLSTSIWIAKGLEIKHSTAKEDSGNPILFLTELEGHVLCGLGGGANLSL
jgi:hypothetical protein